MSPVTRCQLLHFELAARKPKHTEPVLGVNPLCGHGDEEVNTAKTGRVTVGEDIESECTSTRHHTCDGQHDVHT